jgi:hypothetical protein
VAGAGFLLALEKDLQIYRLLNMAIVHRVHRAEDRHDRRLVVASGARVEAGFGIHARVGRGEWNDLPALLDGMITQRRRPGRCHPLFGVERLSVVMRIQHERVHRAGGRKFRVHGRWSTGHGEQTGAVEATTLEHLDEEIRVSPDVGRVAREIGHGEQRRELVHERGFVMLAIRSCLRPSASTDRGLGSGNLRSQRDGGR